MCVGDPNAFWRMNKMYESVSDAHDNGWMKGFYIGIGITNILWAVAFAIYYFSRG